jgi:Cu+-exporting ATPase
MAAVVVPGLARELSSIDSPASNCRHCGEDCRAHAVRTDAGSFCCAGCEAVFALLQREGLDAFYACSTPPGVSQRQPAASFACLDDPAIARRFVDAGDGRIARAVFSVPGMHCASCLWLIERLWKIDAGIVRADADVLRRVVRVTFKPAQTSTRRVAEALASIGYPPALDAEPHTGDVPPARRRLYSQLGVAGFAFGNAMLFSIPRYVNGAPLGDGLQRLFGTLNLALAVPVLVFSASDYFQSAWRAIRYRAINLDVPIALGLAALFTRSVVEIASGRGEGFTDSFTGLVFFLLIGKLFQQKTFDRLAFDRSYRSFLPLSVRVESHDTGQGVLVPIAHLRPGDRLIVRPSEIVPADASLNDEAGAIDLSFVTGEARPVPLRRGDVVPAGARAIDGTLRLTVQRDVDHSRLAGLWNNPVFAKPKTYALADVATRFGAAFTVVAIALAAAGAIAWWPDVGQSIRVATAVLIIACPCALTLAAPITLGTAMAMLARRGIYLKQPAVVLDLARVDAIVFDKTGTLTSGIAIAGDTLDDEIWRLVRRLAAESAHPISRALAGDARVDRSLHVEALLDVPGRGLVGRVGGHDLAIGSPAFVSELAVGVPAEAASGPAVAVDGRFAGVASVVAPIRPGVRGAVRRLRRTYDVCLISGDHGGEAPRWRPIFGADMWFGQAPEAKLAAVRDRQRAGGRVLMIGDGINDAGALAAADVGVAVSDDTACIVPACDAIVAGRRLRDLPRVLRYARRARQTIVACFVVSLVYNAIGLLLALAGLLTPLVTAVLMPVSSLTIVGLSVGAMRLSARVELPG